jgi:hypothetical protein
LFQQTKFFDVTRRVPPAGQQKVPFEERAAFAQKLFNFF